MAKNKRNNNKLKKKYMIIGTFNLDGTSPEPVDISTKGRFFEVEACIVRHPRRYPTYKVEMIKTERITIVLRFVF